MNQAYFNTSRPASLPQIAQAFANSGQDANAFVDTLQRQAPRGLEYLKNSYAESSGRMGRDMVDWLSSLAKPAQAPTGFQTYADRVAYEAQAQREAKLSAVAIMQNAMLPQDINSPSTFNRAPGGAQFLLRQFNPAIGQYDNDLENRARGNPTVNFPSELKVPNAQELLSHKAFVALERKDPAKAAEIYNYLLPKRDYVADRKTIAEEVAAQHKWEAGRGRTLQDIKDKQELRAALKAQEAQQNWQPELIRDRIKKQQLWQDSSTGKWYEWAEEFNEDTQSVEKKVREASPWMRKMLGNFSDQAAALGMPPFLTPEQISDMDFGRKHPEIPPAQWSAARAAQEAAAKVVPLKQGGYTPADFSKASYPSIYDRGTERDRIISPQEKTRQEIQSYLSTLGGSIFTR